MRRKVYNVGQLSNEPGKPHIALGYIQKLYRVEKQLDDMSDEQKAIVWQKLSKPILNAFYASLEGGKTAATNMSIIETAKQNKHNVIFYLRNLFADEKCDELVFCGLLSISLYCYRSNTKNHSVAAHRGKFPLDMQGKADKVEPLIITDSPKNESYAPSILI